MSWGISPNATKKEKIFADYNDSLMGMNSADGLSYRHYSKIYDIGRNLADKEYDQGRADAIEELFNTPMEEFGGMSLKEVYEEACAMPFDEGWNVCYENFLLVAEQLKGAENE